jgi:hypothetical protein
MEASGCRIVTYGRADAEFSIYDVSDIHWLNRGVSKTHLYRDLERIKADPYALYFQGGDYCDWIFPGDPRFDPEAFDEEIKVNDLSHLGALAAKAIIKLFNPIRRKCLGFLMGNHEHKAMTKNSEMYIHDYICKTLKVPNMRFSGWTDVYFVQRPGFRGVKGVNSTIPPKHFTSRLRCFIHHGMGAANTAGGKINKLKSLVDMVEADLVMMGHVHEQFAKAFLRLEPNHNCSEIGQRITMGMITGSYLVTYPSGFTGYGEIKGYSPTTIGATRARYIPATLELTVENRAGNVGAPGTSGGKIAHGSGMER